MIANRVRCAFGALALIASFIASAADAPYLTGRVVDNAEILSPATRAKLARNRPPVPTIICVIPFRGSGFPPASSGFQCWYVWS